MKVIRNKKDYTRSLPSGRSAPASSNKLSPYNDFTPRYTVHPEHTRSFPSMAPRYTVHPEHNKKATNN